MGQPIDKKKKLINEQMTISQVNFGICVIYLYKSMSTKNPREKILQESKWKNLVVIEVMDTLLNHIPESLLNTS